MGYTFRCKECECYDVTLSWSLLLCLETLRCPPKRSPVSEYGKYDYVWWIWLVVRAVSRARVPYRGGLVADPRCHHRVDESRGERRKILGDRRIAGLPAPVLYPPFPAPHPPFLRAFRGVVPRAVAFDVISVGPLMTTTSRCMKVA